jgi:hypothetical protein
MPYDVLSVSGPHTIAAAPGIVEKNPPDVAPEKKANESTSRQGTMQFPSSFKISQVLPFMIMTKMNGTSEVVTGHIARSESALSRHARKTALSGPTLSPAQANARRPMALEALYAATEAAPTEFERPRAPVANSGAKKGGPGRKYLSAQNLGLLVNCLSYREAKMCW